MSEVRSAELGTPDERWVMLAVARDVDTAEAWQDALDEADIGSEIRLEDSVITGRSSALTYANGPSADQLFSYGLWLAASDRERAAQSLIDAGWDGRYGLGLSGKPSMSAGYVVRGTLVALAAAALFVSILLRSGGG